MKIRSFKVGEEPHRTWLDARLTDDPWAFWVPANTPVEEASGSPWSSDFPVIMQFWPERFYQVCLLLKESGTEYYCNVVSPPRFDWSSEIVSFIDLELDVVVANGRVSLVDEDEFAARRGEMTPALAANAVTAAEHLMTLAREKTGPFSPATAKYWHDWLHSR